MSLGLINMKENMYGNLVPRLNCLLLILFVVLLPKMTLAAEADIVINEIGAFEASGYEWLEIYNKGSVAIDITGWKFYEDSTNHGLTLYQGADLTIEAGEYAVIAQDPAKFLTKHTFSGTIFDSSWSSLKEDGELVGLKNSAGDLMENFTYIAAPDFSLERRDPNSKDYSSANWQEHASGDTAGKQNSNYIDSSTATENNNQIPKQNTDNNNCNNILNEGSIYRGNDVWVNEFLPSPQKSEGGGEFIELYNNSSEAINIGCWKLRDKKGATSEYQIPYGTNIAGHSYLVFYSAETHITLNNNGDGVELSLPNRVVEDSPSPFAETAVDGASYNRVYLEPWQWSSKITPGEANIIQKNTRTIEQQNNLINSISSSGQGVASSSAIITSTASQNVLAVKKYEGIIISEFLPNPTGSDETEWIELQNTSSTTVDLLGLMVDDGEGGSKPYIISTSTPIKAGDFFVLSRQVSRLALNNTTDSIRLSNTKGEILQTVEYEEAKEGLSYAFDGDDYVWTDSLTPGAKNIIKGSQEASQQAATTFRFVDINEIQDLQKGDKVVTQGTVVAAPGVLGATIFYIDGIQIYMAKKDFPELNEGDEIQIGGTISESYGEKRILVKTKNDIKILSKQNEITPEQIESANISDEMVGHLVQITGEVMDKKGSNLYIDDGDELRAYVKPSTKIVMKEIAKGAQIKISGIVSKSQTGFRLLPRKQADIEKIGGAAVADTSGQEGGLVVASSGNSKNEILKYLYALVAFSGLWLAWAQRKYLQDKSQQILNFLKLKTRNRSLELEPVAVEEEEVDLFEESFAENKTRTPDNNSSSQEDE